MKSLADNITIPVFVKIRLLDSVAETIELCQQLVQAGAALIAIHARYRVNLAKRDGPGARDGAAMLDQVAEGKSKSTSTSESGSESTSTSESGSESRSESKSTSTSTSESESKSTSESESKI